MGKGKGKGAGKGGSDSPWRCEHVCSDVSECCEEKVVCGGCSCFWVVAILIAVIVVLASSLETIDSIHVGIAYDAYQAHLTAKVQEEGLHTKPTFGYFILWPKTYQQMTQEVKCLSSDGVEVDVKISFQYIADQKFLHQLTLKYKEFDTWSTVVRLISRSGIRNSCSLFSAQQYQTKRASVQTSMFENVKSRLTHGQMHAMVMELQVTNIERPKLYEAAVDAKEAAKNDIARVTNLHTQEIVKANTKLMKVRVAANKTIDTANTEAAMVTKTASAEAAIVLGRYKSLGALYKKVRNDRGLTSEGLLAYIGTRLIDELNGITIGLPAPARMQYLSNTTCSTRL